MLTSCPSVAIGVKPAAAHDRHPGDEVVEMCGVRKRGWSRPAHAGSRPSFDIARKMRGCAMHHHDHDRAETGQRAEVTRMRDGHRGALPPRAGGAHRRRPRSPRPAAPARPASLVRHEADHHARHQHVEHRADDQRSEDAARHVALRIPRLLRRRRHGVEADVGEEDHAGAAQDAAPAVFAELPGVRRNERVPVRRSMKSAPAAITISTTATLMTTITALTVADSLTPTTSSAVTATS